MASTRSSPPASRGGSPEPLTPRSKVKALLAAIDNSDDEGASETITEAQRNKELRKLGLLGNSLRQPASGQNSDRDESEGDDEDDEVEVRPRGRLAARLQGGQTQPKSAAVEQPTHEDAVDVNEGPRDGDATIVSEEEDELPVLPRRLQQRTDRQTTPTADAPRQQTPSGSPGLFVSSPARPSPGAGDAHDSSSEDELPSLKSDRFKALVERKRQERLAREAEEEARRAEREKLASDLNELDDDDDNVSDITDDEGGRKLTQDARPTRKASKRAIEEMNRETQRMARSMQLQHEAKTRTKITTASLFERFNFKPAGQKPQEIKADSSSRPTSPQTDMEVKDVETPPSSPPLQQKQDQPIDQPMVDLAVNAEDVPRPVVDKGKGKAVDLEITDAPAPKQKRQFRVKMPARPTKTAEGSDDELQVTRTAQDKINDIFNRVPKNKANESQSLQALRALANLRSPGKNSGRNKGKPGITGLQLEARLRQSAREQARQAREHRLEMLKASGVVVQTAEEREREMEEVDDMVAKAREEGQKIQQQEREADKHARRENGEVDPLAWDDSDDEEYQASADEAEGPQSELELSGSEDEEAEGEGDDNGVLDMAEEAGSDEAEPESEKEADEEQDDEEMDVTPAVNTRRPRRQVAVFSDDEEELGVEATPRPKSTMPVQTTPSLSKTIPPFNPGSVLRSAKKTFIPGLPVEGPAGLGLTQMFAGTMDSQGGTPNGPTQSMMPDYSQFPDSNFSATAGESVEDVVMDSQNAEVQAETQGFQFSIGQTQAHGLDSLLEDKGATQFSEMELTQDVGFQEHTPLRERYVEPPISTVETVAVEGPDESPLVPRKRLHRRTEVNSDSNMAQTPTKTAFGVLETGAVKQRKQKEADDFDRKKSKAKGMVEEQAEESEDEYAGLGGHDGEDSDNESLASVNDMIDDAAATKLDERKLAGFHAGLERAQDEKDVEKLFKDITTGMLRRKRGADYDLSDSDDGGEARRRVKRRQFAKMQKALYSNERVKKMAENPGNQAFLRTIGGLNSDDEMDLLDITEEQPEEESESQSQEANAQIIPDSQPRRPLGNAGANRAPAAARRTADGRKPSNIGDVRRTLSNLLEDPHSSIIPATEAGSDSDEGERSPRRDKENRRPSAVVDRISLKRGASNQSTSSSRQAFAANPSASSFKVPALLRRATTNSSLTSSTSSTGVSVGGGFGGFGDKAKIKKAASRKTGINAFARESERRQKIQESERRREERKAKGAERRMGVVGGLLGKGSFE